MMKFENHYTEEQVRQILAAHGKPKKANYLGMVHYFNLNEACKTIHKAFGKHPYLVGSSLETPAYRDVDVRLILDNDDPFLANKRAIKLTEITISEWLSARTQLPIDFQIQSMLEANKDHKGQRSALGMSFEYGSPDETATK